MSTRNDVTRANLRREVARDNLKSHLKNHVPHVEGDKSEARHKEELATLEERIKTKEPYRKYRKRKI